MRRTEKEKAENGEGKGGERRRHQHIEKEKAENLVSEHFSSKSKN